MSPNPLLVAPSVREDLLRLVHEQIANVQALHDYLHEAENILRRHTGSVQWRRWWSGLSIQESMCWGGHFVLMAALDAIRCSN